MKVRLTFFQSYYYFKIPLQMIDLLMLILGQAMSTSQPCYSLSFWKSLRIELLWGQKSCKRKNMPFPLLWMTASYSCWCHHEATLQRVQIKCSIGDLVMMMKRNWLDSKPTFDSVPRILNVVKYHRDYLSFWIFFFLLGQGLYTFLDQSSVF